jgi:ABC-2 type transport system permease protein
MPPALRIIREIIRKEFYEIRQDRRMLLVSVVAPLLQVIVLGYAATTDIKEAPMAVCDLDRTEASRAMVSAFTNSRYFVEKYAVDSPDEIDALMERAEITVALVIPRQFGSRILAREQAPVQMIMDGTEGNTANILLGYAGQIIQKHSQDIVLRSGTPARRLPAGRVIPEPRIWFNPDLKSSNFMVPGVVALVLMIITMTLTSLGIVREKEIGTLEQLMVTPIRPYQLIIGKLLPFTVIGFLDVIVVLAVAIFWFEVPLVGSLLLLWGLGGLFILTTLGLGLLISTIARSQQQAMLIAQFFFFMPFMFLSGFAFPISNMPAVLQYIAYFIPLRYFLEIVRGIFLKGSTLGELWPQAAALTVLGVVIFTLSVLRFRRTLG